MKFSLLLLFIFVLIYRYFDRKSQEADLGSSGAAHTVQAGGTAPQATHKE